MKIEEVTFKSVKVKPRGLPIDCSGLSKEYLQQLIYEGFIIIRT